MLGVVNHAIGYILEGFKSSLECFQSCHTMSCGIWKRSSSNKDKNLCLFLIFYFESATRLSSFFKTLFKPCLWSFQDQAVEVREVYLFFPKIRVDGGFQTVVFFNFMNNDIELAVSNFDGIERFLNQLTDRVLLGDRQHLNFFMFWGFCHKFFAEGCQTSRWKPQRAARIARGLPIIIPIPHSAVAILAVDRLAARVPRPITEPWTTEWAFFVFRYLSVVVGFVFDLFFKWEIFLTWQLLLSAVGRIRYFLFLLFFLFFLNKY